MREFLIYSRKGSTSSDFTLKDLPGSGGRMDLNARCIISALWVSRNIRRDTRIMISLNGPPNPPFVIAFDGNELRKVSPDERNISIWIKKALREADEARDDKWSETHEGIYISKKSFQDLIRDNEDRSFYILHERGKDIRDIEVRGNPFFVLGDHIGLPRKEEKFVQRYTSEKISLGPESYFTSQSITLVHNELDRARKYG